MTRVVDARDVDHATEQIANNWPCENEWRSGVCTNWDPCARCVGVGMLRQMPRVEMHEPVF